MSQTEIGELAIEQTEEEVTFISITNKSAMTSMQFELNTVTSNVD